MHAWKRDGRDFWSVKMQLHVVLDEGNSARGILGNPTAAVKTVIVGVVDYVDAPQRIYDHRTPRAKPVSS